MSDPSASPTPRRRASGFQRFALCFQFEVAKLRRRALPWLGLVAAVVAVGSVPLFTDSPTNAGEAWTELAEMVRRGLEISSLLIVILGATCVNCERQSSALRAYLLRPVSRSEILGAKALTLFSFAGLLVAVVLGLSWTLASMRFGFEAITVEIEGLEPVMKFDGDAMQDMVSRLQLVATLPVFLFAALGLFVSTIIDSEATAVTLSILCRMFLGFLAEAFSDQHALGGLRSIATSYERIAELARGIETQVQDIEKLTLTHAEIGYPLMMLAGLIGASFVVFCKRELNP